MGRGGTLRPASKFDLARLVPCSGAAKEEGRGISGQPRPRFLLEVIRMLQAEDQDPPPPQREAKECVLCWLSGVPVDNSTACRAQAWEDDGGAAEGTTQVLRSGPN
jgi:hypothetical protein